MQSANTSGWFFPSPKAHPRSAPRSYPIIDVDMHHENWLQKVLPYMDPIWRLRAEIWLNRQIDFHFFPDDLGDPYVAGRIRRPQGASGLAGIREAQRRLGIDISVLHPGEILSLGLHPQVDAEVAIARAYARWMTEDLLPREPTFRSMLYLPINDAEASLELIETYGDRPGVIGFMVTSIREQPLYHNRYMPVYAALEERGLPLAFHPTTPWRQHPFRMLNNMIATYTLGPTLYHVIHLTNLVINGICERFPRLRILFLECGIAWLVWIRNRLDLEYMMRRSEAPLLNRRPSEYIQESIFVSTQPLELVTCSEHQREVFRMLGGADRFLFASNYPGWDFDTPDRIRDLTFLTEEVKRKILYENAARLFGLENDVRRPASSPDDPR